MSKPLSIGAFAALQYLPHIETFLATGDGDFDGPIWAKATSEITHGSAANYGSRAAACHQVLKRSERSCSHG